MSNDDWDSPSDPENWHEDDDKDAAANSSRSQLPKQLQNWRVVEIDGASTTLEPATYEAGAPSKDALREQPPDTPDALPPAERTDKIDALILLSVTERETSVEPGQSSTTTVSVLNNANLPAVLEITTEGRVSPTWFPELPIRVTLQAGERQSYVLLVIPPVGAGAPAGEYAFEIVARSLEKPSTHSRVACTILVERHTDFALGLLQPEKLTTSWWSSIARTSLPVANLSNHPANFRIVGADSDRSCLFEFEPPGSVNGQVGQAAFTLGAGARSSVGVSLLPKSRPVISLWPSESPFRIAVEMTGTGDMQTRQVTEGRIVKRALVGPWQMAALVAFVGVVLAVLMTSSAVMLYALRDVQNQVAAPSEVVVPTSPPAPAFALVLSMDQPVPTREPSADVPVYVPANEERPRDSLPLEIAPVTGPDGLPVVQAGQVSAPGEPVVLSPWQTSQDSAPNVQPVPPTPIAVAPVDPANMTYAQMFQLVAGRYDMNWRILAAQGYVESGFDSTAVGRHGSMGLMQIHPDTWQEWAPRVDVDDPFDTYGNALVASIYLDYLRATLGKEGYPQVEWMLAAYNWGPDKVLDHLAGGGDWTDLPAEVQQYATDILRIAQSIP
jgi:membrane-bound lytic murein transglycosylase F